MPTTSTSPHSLSAPPDPRSRRFGTGVDARVLDLSRLLLGASVIALGVVFLLDAAGVLNADRAIDRWWPLVIVAAGAFTLAERPPSVRRGLLLAAAGGVLLLFTTDVVEESGWSYVWPAAIVLAGLAIVARWSGRTIAGDARADDVVRSTAIFGGHKLTSTAQAFHGAWLTAIFGGCTLDLRQARLAPEGASVNATVAFGGVDILVPKGWRISVRSTPIFGGVEEKTDRTTPPPADAPTLHVDAVAVFGGVNVKHEK
jgi:predicted membrane protein